MYLSKLMLKFIWKNKRPRIVSTIPKKKGRRYTLLDIKPYYRAMILKIVLYWQNNREIDQRNNLELPEIDFRKYC